MSTDLLSDLKRFEKSQWATLTVAGRHRVDGAAVVIDSMRKSRYGLRYYAEGKMIRSVDIHRLRKK